MRQTRKSLRLRNWEKRLRRSSPTQKRPVSNGSEADASESIMDTANTNGLATTTDSESDAFDDDEIYLSSLSDSDEDNY